MSPIRVTRHLIETLANTPKLLISGADFAQFVMNGLSRGMILFLIASGLTLIFGLIGLINFAHGALFTLGGYITLAVTVGSGSYWLGLLCAVVLVVILGLALERTLLHHLYENELLGFLATFGIGLVIEELIGLYWGNQTRLIDSPLSGSLSLGTITYPTHRVFVIAAGAVVAVVVGYLLARTRLGKEIYATAVEEDTAEIIGIDSARVYSVTFVLGVALAAFAGGLTAPITGMYPLIGLNYMLIAFLIVIVGGMGSFKGSLVASLIIGQIISFGSNFITPTYVNMGIFLAAMVFIVFRPRGFFGHKGVFE
jgi:branched-subunit amino acid ABC-type transport system permease component